MSIAFKGFSRHFNFGAPIFLEAARHGVVKRAALGRFQEDAATKQTLRIHTDTGAARGCVILTGLDQPICLVSRAID